MRSYLPGFVWSSIVAIGFTAACQALQPPRPPEGRRDSAVSSTDPKIGGIQWFATWSAAKAEAIRTNKPILMISAAPHCSGISGIW